MPLISSQRIISRTIKQRIIISLVVVAILFLVLLGNLWYLQIIAAEKFTILSQGNRIRLQRVRATSGLIYDRRMKVLVTNRPCFSLFITLEDVEDLPKTVSLITKLLGLPVEQIKKRIAERESQQPFVPIRLKRDLSMQEVATIEEHKVDLPGVTIDAEAVRHYPGKKSAAHLIGSVGEINQQQLKSPRYQRFKAGDFIGQFGLEKTLNLVLAGYDGGKQVEVDAYGRELKVLGEEAPIPGLNLVLTIDSQLQQKADELLAGKTGAIVAMNPQNGEILALANNPSFDPNKFALGISADDWSQLINNPLKPLQNRAIQSQYPPGSVFKIVTATAALEEHIVNSTTELFCPGYYKLSGWRYECWKSGGHGKLSIHRAIVESCNVFFYQVGVALGVEKIARFAQMFGLGKASGIELPGEKEGLVPTAEWKEKNIGELWLPGNTVSLAIGQGYLMTTPIQLANMISTIANGGTLYKPMLVKKILFADGRLRHQMQPQIWSKLSLSEQTLTIIRRALGGVVNEKGGTGGRARLRKQQVAGKTGTAQVIKLETIEELPEEELPLAVRDHGWFVCFAPLSSAEIALAVFLEHGGKGGRVAAPLARELLRKFFASKPDSS